jgi:hypothetical protein
LRLIRLIPRQFTSLAIDDLRHFTQWPLTSPPCLFAQPACSFANSSVFMSMSSSLLYLSHVVSTTATQRFAGTQEAAT